MLAGSGIPVFVGKDRLASIKKAEKAGFSYIIMDDGFQNPTIKKALSILVFDSKIGVGNGFLLPAGPLREPLRSGLKKADAVVIVGANDNSPLKNSSLESKGELSFAPTFHATNKTENPIKGRVLAFAGIGYPKKFFDSLNPAPVKTVSFPDHYDYSEKDLEALLALARRENAKLLTTEKDWVKFPDKYKKLIKFAPLKTTVEPEFWEWLESRL